MHVDALPTTSTAHIRATARQATAVGPPQDRVAVRRATVIPVIHRAIRGGGGGGRIGTAVGDVSGGLADPIASQLAADN